MKVQNATWTNGMIDTNKLAERELVPMFELEGLPYVPHYSKRHYWVAPGGIERTTTWLRERHAQLKMDKTCYLWPRSWTLDVDLT